MMNCKQTTEIASNTLDRKLGIVEWISLRTHLLICVHCRRYLKQISFLSRATSQIDEKIESQADLTLSSEVKNQIKEQLNKH